MTREQRIDRNIAKWRALPKEERRRIMHASAAKFVASSMAMEGEPVPQEWLKKNVH